MNQPIIKHRGVIYPEKILPRLRVHDYSFVEEQKMGFYLSYKTEYFQFHAVDRFASFPLFYCIKNGKPYVSEKIDDLLPHLYEIKFDPVGFYGTGGILKGRRSHRTPFVGIERIMPGHYLEYKDRKINLIRYWSFLSLKDKPFLGAYKEACEELGFLINQAVKRCYEFAPNAALHLSGGLDSGSITSIISQLSNEEREVFVYLNEGAPLDNDKYESGYIYKYKELYPHLNININKYHSLLEQKIDLYPSAGNWHIISKVDNHEIKTLEKAKTEKIKYILTGLGGDELASYGSGQQRLPFLIHNDRQARLYWSYFKNKRKYKAYIKGILGKNGNIQDALAATYMSRVNLNRNYWYTNQFINDVSELTKKMITGIGLLPSSYNYRLEILNRRFFTIRSDIWNFVGNDYGVDYIHPLLDADIVEFCAMLPPKMYSQYVSRNLIKSALKNQIPNHLLKGTKREIYFPTRNQSKKILALKITEALDKLKTVENTFANTIFDYGYMNKTLNYYNIKLPKIPNTHKQRLFQIERRISQTFRTINHGLYVNQFFKN